MVIETDYSATIEEIYHHLHAHFPDAVIKRNVFTTKTPDDATAIAQYGFDEDKETGIQTVRVQVMARAKSSSVARVEAQRLSLAISRMRGPYRAAEDVDPVEYINAWRLSGPVFIKSDESDRNYYSANIQIKKQGFSPASTT